jgi:predicted DNA repair protein MutK
MAASSLLALIDDIASVLDDVAVMTKVATKKTVGVLGDDLALNAQQVSGVRADRELPVVWAVAKGSFRNKAILVPAALAISAFAPWAVRPLLMIGGLFLCYEGFEKLAHKWAHRRHEGPSSHPPNAAEPPGETDSDPAATEARKIKGAIRTDFVLSAEIIAITLGTVAGAPFLNQVAVLVGIAVLMTVGVYGLVAAIIKLDDFGLFLTGQAGQGVFARVQRGLGTGILRFAPWLMKTLSVLGTAAMFLVGGGILVHGLPWAHHWIEGVAQDVALLPGVGGVLQVIAPSALAGLGGVVAGALALCVVSMAQRLLRARNDSP